MVTSSMVLSLPAHITRLVGAAGSNSWKKRYKGWAVKLLS